MDARERERLLQLREEIAYHDDLYYKKAAPVISDAEYDALKLELRKLEALYPEASAEESVGDDRVGRFLDAAHLAPMLSLEKAYSESELLAFHEQVATLAGTENIAYSVEPKIDGMAVSVVYEDGVFVRAVTRGNGVQGELISENTLEIPGLPRRLSGSGFPKRIELRGEIYITFDDFRKVNLERIDAGKDTFSHPRSLAAGSAKLGDPGEIARRRLSIVFFGFGDFSSDSPTSQSDLYELARSWGVPVLSKTMTVEGFEALSDAIENLQKERLSYPFPTDGTVVKVDSVELQRKLGESRSAPHWALAYKSSGQMIETRVLGITLQIGRSGVVTPVAELETVELAGSRISRASLHNVAEIEEMDLRIGDTVYLEKAGEVIPQVKGVNFAKRDSFSVPYVFPDTCPSCAETLFSSAEEVRVYCVNENCFAKIRRRLEHFASPQAVAIDGLGTARIEALVEQGGVRTIPDLYRLDIALLLNLEGFTFVSAERLIAALQASKDRDLWRFVFGLGIPNIGKVRAQAISKNLRSLEDLVSLVEADFESGGRAGVWGLRPSVRDSLLAFLSVEDNRRLIDDLVELGVSPRVDKVNTDFPLAGMTFAFSGRLPTLTRIEATELVEAAGGLVRTSLSKHCDYLVVGADAGNKVLEASKLGIAVIDEMELKRLLEL